MLKRFFLSAIAAVFCFGLVKADYPHPMESMSGLYGYANSVGQMVIKPRYDNALPFREGFAAVERRGKWGFIDLRGKVIAKLIYDSVKDFNYGFAIVQLNGKWGAIDTDGNLIVPCEHDTYGELENLKVVHLPDGGVQVTTGK